MAREIKEIKDDIIKAKERLTEIEKEKAELFAQYEEIKKEKLSRFPECCSEVCTEVTRLILKLKENRASLEETKKVAPKTMSLKINRQLILNEERTKELEDLKNELYAKSICDCR